MKKLLIALLILGVAVIAVLSFGGDKLLADPVQTPEKTEAPSVLPTPVLSQEPETSPAEEQEETEVQPAAQTDYAAIYALHDPDEVVMRVDDKEITWQDYFYAYFSQASSMEQQFQMYQYYGYALGWESQADEEGHSYAELLALMGEQNLRRILTAESVAEEQKVRLLPEEEASIQEEHQENILYFCGEEGTEEQLLEQLWNDRYLSPDMYWRVMRFGTLTQAINRSLYGNEGARLNDRQVQEWVAEQGILSADHILVSTMDPTTNQALDEAAAAEKAELARQIAGELQAIEDPAEREARFLELKAEHGEDPGAAEGYVFGPGVMVQAFYDGALALEEGQISDPIQTDYGYHIILRRPVRPDDAVITESGDVSVRVLMAQALFNRMMQERMDAQVIEYVSGFEPPHILDYQTVVDY